MPKKQKATVAITLPTGITQLGPFKYKASRMIEGKRYSENHNTPEAAIQAYNRFALDHQKAKENGMVDVSKIKGAWTLRDAYNRAFTDRWRNTPSEKTVEMFAECAIKYFGEYILAAKVNDKEMIGKFRDYCAATLGNGDKTINKKLSVLKIILETAKEYNQILAEVVKMPRKRIPNETNRREVTYKEEEEALELFEALGKADHRDAFIVLIDGGFRLGELWRITAKTCDFNMGVVHVWISKNYTARSVPMTDRVANILHQRAQLYPEGSLFPGCNKDWMINGWNLVRRHMGLADDPGFVPHSLRHTCCSRLVRGGMKITDVQKWMGHKDINITMRYYHLAPGQLMVGIQALKNARELSQGKFTPNHPAESTNTARQSTPDLPPLQDRIENALLQ